MKRLILNLCMAACVGVHITSCSEDEVISTKKTQVLFSVDKFESSVLTRTNVDPSNNYAITWAQGDKIGIFPREGYQEPFEIPAEQIGQGKASFDGGYWELKSGLTYNAYYPFDKANFESAEMKTKIPVSYVGQTQNGTTCGIGSYDYTYSDWATAGTGSLNFNFHHIGAFMIFSLPIPASTSYSSLTIETENAVIPLKGSYDLTATTPAFVADESSLSNSITVELKNFTGTANENAIIYMMMPPVDLSSKTLTLTLNATEGGSCTYSIEGTNIIAAQKYEMEGSPTGSTVSGTTFDWLIEHGIISADLSFNITLPNASDRLSSATVPGSSNLLNEFSQVMKALKVKGDLNSDDIRFIRNLPALEVLDLSEANIIEGGEPYYIYDVGKVEPSYVYMKTITNEFPVFFLRDSQLDNLEFIALPNSVKTMKNGSLAYGNIREEIHPLKQIILGDSLLTTEKFAFACSIETIHIPSKVTIGYGTFANCPNLKEITIDPENTKYKFDNGALYEYQTDNVSGKVYYLHTYLAPEETVEFPDDIIVGALCGYAFSKKPFTSIIIPESRSLGIAVANLSFYNNPSLKSVTLPTCTKGLTSISFYLCNALEELHIKAVEPPVFGPIEDENANHKTCKLYVPESWKSSSSDFIDSWTGYFTTIIYE